MANTGSIRAEFADSRITAAGQKASKVPAARSALEIRWCERLKRLDYWEH
jgi:hypothetical protein